MNTDLDITGLTPRTSHLPSVQMLTEKTENPIAKPKSPSTLSKVVSSIGGVIILAIVVSFSRACQTQRMETYQLQKATTIVTVWVPNTFNGRMIPYRDVEILKQDQAYIKFRTQDGPVIEHSGTYQVQTANRE